MACSRLIEKPSERNGVACLLQGIYVGGEPGAAQGEWEGVRGEDSGKDGLFVCLFVESLPLYLSLDLLELSKLAHKKPLCVRCTGKSSKRSRFRRKNVAFTRP